MVVHLKNDAVYSSKGSVYFYIHCIEYSQTVLSQQLVCLQSLVFLLCFHLMRCIYNVKKMYSGPPTYWRSCWSRFVRTCQKMKERNEKFLNLHLKKMHELHKNDKAESRWVCKQGSRTIFMHDECSCSCYCKMKHQTKLTSSLVWLRSIYLGVLIKCSKWCIV